MSRNPQILTPRLTVALTDHQRASPRCRQKLGGVLGPVHIDCSGRAGRLCCPGDYHRDLASCGTPAPVRGVRHTPQGGGVDQVG